MAKPNNAYDRSSVIDSFFASSKSVTRQQCDDWVISHFKTPALPVPIQQTFRYTVTASTDDSKIVQFQKDYVSLAPTRDALVQQAASCFIPDTLYHGTIGEQDPLYIYEMKNVPGKAHVLARNTSMPQPNDAKSRQRNTIQDLARYNQRGHARRYPANKYSEFLRNLGIVKRTVLLTPWVCWPIVHSSLGV